MLHLGGYQQLHINVSKDVEIYSTPLVVLENDAPVC